MADSSTSPNPSAISEAQQRQDHRDRMRRKREVHSLSLAQFAQVATTERTFAQRNKPTVWWLEWGEKMLQPVDYRPHSTAADDQLYRDYCKRGKHRFTPTDAVIQTAILRAMRPSDNGTATGDYFEPQCWLSIDNIGHRTGLHSEVVRRRLKLLQQNPRSLIRMVRISRDDETRVVAKSGAVRGKKHKTFRFILNPRPGRVQLQPVERFLRPVEPPPPPTGDLEPQEFQRRVETELALEAARNRVTATGDEAKPKRKRSQAPKWDGPCWCVACVPPEVKAKYPIAECRQPNNRPRPEDWNDPDPF